MKYIYIANLNLHDKREARSLCSLAKYTRKRYIQRWGSLIRPHAVITRCNLAVSNIYTSFFGKDALDSLYVLLCRYIRSQATHKYISRSAASYEEPISSYIQLRTKVAVFKAIILTIEPQPAGPTFARSARVNGTCTTYGRIYIYKKHIYIYIYI